MIKWILIISIIIPILISILLTVYEAKIKGYIGEKTVSKSLSKLPKDKYIVLNNIMIPSDFGLTQIDHIVVSIYGIFVVETKNYTGWITGGERSDNWVKNVYGNKYEFRNPLKQNYAHIKSLMKLLDINDKSLFISIIVFSEATELKVETQENVIYYSELKETIRKYNSQLFSYEQIHEYSELILSSNVDSKANRKDHIRQIHNSASERNHAIKSGTCPRCGKQLVLRNGRYGQFWGCSGYPSCRFTQNK